MATVRDGDEERGALDDERLPRYLEDALTAATRGEKHYRYRLGDGKKSGDIGQHEQTPGGRQMVVITSPTFGGGMSGASMPMIVAGDPDESEMSSGWAASLAGIAALLCVVWIMVIVAAAIILRLVMP